LLFNQSCFTVKVDQRGSKKWSKTEVGDAKDRTSDRGMIKITKKVISVRGAHTSRIYIISC